MDLWHSLKSQMGTDTGLGKAGWGLILGRGCFLIRVIANAINYEHLCLRKINRTPPSLWGPDVWDPSSPWLHGKFRGLLIHRSKACHISACIHPGYNQGQCSVCTLQLGTELPHLLPSPGVRTMHGWGPKPRGSHWPRHRGISQSQCQIEPTGQPPTFANDCSGEGEALSLSPLRRPGIVPGPLMWSWKAQEWGSRCNPAS